MGQKAGKGFGIHYGSGMMWAVSLNPASCLLMLYLHHSERFKHARSTPALVSPVLSFAHQIRSASLPPGCPTCPGMC